MVPESSRRALLEEAAQLPAIQLDPDALCALELIAIGALAPWEKFSCGGSGQIHPGQRVTLRDGENRRLGVLTVETAGERLTGSVELLDLPKNPGFASLRRRPDELKRELAAAGKSRVIAYWVDGWVDQETLEQLRREDAAVLLLVARRWNAGPKWEDFAAARGAIAAAELLPQPAFVNLVPWPGEDRRRRAVIERNLGATESYEHVAPKNASYHPRIQQIIEEITIPSQRQGFCVWFTGLPSSGKSTIAQELATLLVERGRRVTVLDGDVVRTHLSKGLGFSREDRDTNILRIGFVAGEIVRHNGAVICAAVSPYGEARRRAREMCGDGFVLVHVATPPEICEERDVKGFYARARAGAMSGMTGVDDPYEPPEDAEITLTTTAAPPRECARTIAAYLERQGLLTGPGC
ncbi:MAG: adenylyl-sulfate kinase [Acidimicrobiia bacterium]|nr:adenylyl-sulfate kinase [Acidimicrobiia bacterium]